jgi:hypothetical protein
MATYLDTIKAIDSIKTDANVISLDFKLVNKGDEYLNLLVIIKIAARIGISTKKTTSQGLNIAKMLPHRLFMFPVCLRSCVDRKFPFALR